jgi:4-hydroxybenzoate polyprenyltransferase
MKRFLSLIKFSHTIFALPFALVGFFLATFVEEKPIDFKVLACVVLCMVFARSAAMAFNRYLDRDIDALNPRTAVREIPAGEISAGSALGFVVGNALLFMLTTYFINPLCFALSPVALAVVLGYSYTKRFTALCHFILGLGLSLAPLGAYLSVTGEFAVLPVLYAAVVLLWVAGFDIIYALQDEHFDRENNLNSLPVFLGRKQALWLSNGLHILCALVFSTLLFKLWQLDISGHNFGLIHALGGCVFLALLFYQHTLVKVSDLSKVNLAFFTTNGIASVTYGISFIIDYFF